MLSTAWRQQMLALQELTGKVPLTTAQFRWGLLRTCHHS